MTKLEAAESFFEDRKEYVFCAALCISLGLPFSVQATLKWDSVCAGMAMGMLVIAMVHSVYLYTYVLRKMHSSAKQS